MERRSKSYLQLIKPGITLSNTLSGAAGFFFAAVLVGFEWGALIGALGGIAFVIASACVTNNIIDRDIDKKMKRTKRRVVVEGSIGVRNAALYAAVLGLVGFTLLLTLTNVLTFMLGVVAFLWYVVVYGIAKRTTALSTIIGGVPGALPPMAGYTALTGSIDAAAIILFLILFFWQLPHFYAISIFRKDDYSKADLPVWAVRHGVKSAKVHIFISVVLYAVVVSLLFFYGYTGVSYLIASSALSLYWLYKGVSGYRKADDVKWARTMFGASLLVLTVMFLVIPLGALLP